MSNKKKMKDQVIATFTRQLALVLDSDLPVNSGLTVIKSKTNHQDLIKVIDGVQEELKQGGSLSEGIAKFENELTPFVVSMIELGEKSGNLISTLNQIADSLEKEIEVKIEKPTEIMIETLHYVTTHSLKYSVFKSLVQETNTNQARISICNNTNGKTTIYIGPFETEELQNKMIELIGTTGKIESDLFGPSLYFYNKNSLASKLRGKIRIIAKGLNPKVPDEALSLSYKNEIENFLSSILDDREPNVTGKEAREVLKTTLAIYESSKTKSVVFLE